MNKLLILGATYHEITIIDRARSKGIYTIVTDSNLDYSKSPAKLHADEVWDISWSDIDALYIKAKERGVDGVLAGFSEFRVENMIKLSEKLHLPCYLTMEQLDLTRDKIKFKQLCNEYHIPVVPEYAYGDVISYPVIIKPVDRAGSIGINVAYDPESFEKFYRIAMDLSPSRTVIIEDFIDDGIKIDVYYYVKDGVISLLGTSDTILCDGTLGAPILQKGWVFPSLYQKQYLDGVDHYVRGMLEGIGFDNGYVTMSAFYRKGSFYFFEAGFRLSGELSFNYYDYISGINYVDNLIDYSLGVSNDSRLADCFKLNESAKSVILNYFGLDGYVDEIIVPDNIDEPGMRVLTDLYVRTGEAVENDTSVFRKIAMCTILSDDDESLKSFLRKVNDKIRISDRSGRTLIYEKVDDNVLGLTSREIVVDDNVLTIMPKPYWISWNEIQALLNEAHETNMELGLKYATYNQSIADLKEKVRNSICLVVFVGDRLAGTGTVQFRSINHWYHNGEIGLLKLLAVSPKYRGLGLASLLTEERIRISEQMQKELVVTDSAETNVAIKNLYLGNGFKVVDCCKYPENNFISLVYAKWLNGGTFDDAMISQVFGQKYGELMKML
ncbi:MAG: GNAT family N-acetyltransferase [Bacteroidales bacterium]|nr:GNAT family N-acetyltransferase [Bacteroidales bacterium]